MESLDSNLPREGTFFGTQEVKEYLSETTKWGKFLAIVGFVVMGLMVIGALIVALGSSQLGSVTGLGSSVGIFALIYIVVAGIYFFPVYYLFQSSVKIKQGLESQNLQVMTDGFKNLKSLFKFMGIFTIIIFVIYAAAILFTVLK